MSILWTKILEKRWGVNNNFSHIYIKINLEKRGIIQMDKPNTEQQTDKYDPTTLFGLLKSLGWNPATRDDKKILDALIQGEELEDIYTLTEEGLLDPFFDFLDEANITECLKEITQQNYQRVIVPVVLLTLTYMVKILIGIPSMNAMPNLLFSKTSLMKIIGFNAYILSEGICDRGNHIRHEENDPPTPFSTQMLSNFVERFKPKEVEKLFNSIIQALAKFGAFDDKINVIIDSSDLETTDKYKDCGSVTKIKKTVNKKGNVVETEITVYGFKIIAIIDVNSQIPVAVKVVKINQHESNFTLDLLKTAIKNLKGYVDINTIVADRGFLDGHDLFKIDKMGISFVVPSKKKMNVYIDAKKIAHSDLDDPEIIIRDTRSHIVKNKKLTTTVAGIKDLNTFDSYCSKETYKHRNAKDFMPNNINTVVVLEWDNKKYSIDKGVVFLTNKNVEKPFIVFDNYDDRSLIENLLFRETKQGWHLEKSPKKTFSAMTAHAILTMATHALTLAYRDHKEDEYKKEEEKRHRSFTLGSRRWRREIKKEEQDYIIIFIDDKYGILHVAEFATMGGFKVKTAPEGMKTIKEIYESRNLTFN